MTADSSGGNTPVNNDLNDSSNDDFYDDLELGEVAEDSQFENYQDIQQAGTEVTEEGESHGEGDAPVDSGGNNAEGENTYLSDNGRVAPPDDDRSEFDMWAEIQRDVQRTRNNQDDSDDQDD